MSFWSDIKKLFGKDEPDYDPEDYRDGEKDLLDKISQIDEEYRKKEAENKTNIADLLPEDPGYEYLEYKGESEDEIVDRVKGELGALEENELEKLLSEYGKETSKVEESKDDAKTAAAKNETAAVRKTDASKQKNVSDMVKKNLYRSSIKGGVDDALDKSLEKQKGAIAGKLRDKLGDIDREMEELGKERDNAVDKLELSYASKIQTQIDKLTDARKIEMDRIEKYNNALKEKEAAYKKEREETILEEKRKQILSDFEREKAERETGYVGEKKDSYDERLRLAADFYKSLPKSVATNLVKENGMLKKYLGQNYAKLVYEVGRM